MLRADSCCTASRKRRTAPHPSSCQRPYPHTIQYQACVPAQAAWSRELQLHREGRSASLVRALRRAFGLEVMMAGVWKLCWSVLVILGECWAAVVLPAESSPGSP